jgi:hypothetical protein
MGRLFRGLRRHSDCSAVLTGMHSPKLGQEYLKSSKLLQTKNFTTYPERFITALARDDAEQWQQRLGALEHSE